MAEVRLKFLKIIFWEYIQNLPLLAGFVLAHSFWQQKMIWTALLCIVAGSLAGALLIALTENKKVAGHREHLEVIIANIAGMSILMLALVAYLSAHWSSWLTDLIIGALGGSGLGAIQSLAARQKIGLRHCLALGIAALLILVSIRFLLTIGLPIWVNILFVSILATLIISYIDYAPGNLPSSQSS